ncbi:MAG: right-handed parallel beta-helix repeat-containing protein [Bacteroidia bacterium]|nr:right-handed parallel beta-helix repeat-containing protein [Bacteroidia bacterium]
MNTLPVRFRSLLLSLCLMLAFASAAQAQLSGVFTIGGTTPSYTTFTAAVADLTLQGVSGPVTFNVRNGVYNEQISIPPITGSSATNTITFQSENLDSSLVTMTFAPGSGTNWVVQLNGVNYVTFRKLTLKSIGSSFATAVSINSGSNNCAFRNNVLEGNVTTSTSSNLAVIFDAGTGANNLTLEKNVIRYGSYGMYLNGPTGLQVMKNAFVDQYYMGAYLTYNNSMLVTENSVSSNSAYSNYYGLYASYCDNDIQVTKNKVNITNQGYYGIYLQYCDGSSVLRQNISNNMVHIGGTSGNGYGIYTNSCTYQNFYYNSVNVTRTSGSLNAFTQAPTTGSSNINLQNNILKCDQDFAIYINQPTAIASSNYNDLYTQGANLGYWSGNRATLAAWQSASAKDNNSVSMDPIFQSNSNLHVQNYLLNNLGFPVAGITTDIDGQTRNVTTPDIGADEFTPPVNDAGITAIDHDLSLCTNSDSVYVTLKNFGSAALTSATINWSVNGTPQTPFSWTGSLAQGASEGPFSIGFFNFGLGAPYTILVWSSNPNGSPDGLSFNDSLSINTTYQALSGTFTIGGTTPDFITINNAVTALIQGGVCGPVVFNIRNGIYNEQISIPTIAGVSPTNTITFQSQSLDSSLVTMSFAPGAGTNWVVQLNGVSYVTFRKMSIKSIGSSYATVINLGTGSNNCAFRNNLLESSVTTSTSSNLAVILDAASGANNLVLENNRIKNGSYGMYFNGPTGLQVMKNDFVDQYYMGMYLTYDNSMVVTENNISSNSAYSNYYGLFASYCDNDIHVTKNKVNITNQGYYGIYLQYCDGTSVLRQDISNNMVHIGGTTGAGYGIYPYSCTYQNYYYNSVNMTRTSTSQYAFFQGPTSGSSNINLQNNILKCDLDFAIYIQQPTAIASSNYNDLYTLGANLGYWNGNRADLAAWKAGSSKDNNSISIDPLYKSNSNLHVQNYLINNLGFPVAGITTDIDGETRHLTNPDMGADEFTPPANDAGITSIDQSMSLCSTSDSVYVTIKNFGSSTLTSATINWSVNGTPQTPFAWTGSLTQGASEGPFSIGFFNFGLGTPYTINVWSTNPNGSPDGLSYNDSLSVNSTYQALSGTFTIGGTTPDFATINNAVNALIQGGVCGPVVFNIRNGVYNEQISIPTIAGVSAVNTITFQSQSLDSSLVTMTFAPGSGTNWVVQLNGGAYITFRKMTIKSIGSSYATVINLGTGSNNCAFRNNVLEGSVTTSTSTNLAVILDAGSGANDLLLENNLIKYGSYGMFFNGPTGLQVKKNHFLDQYYTGMYLSYNNSMLVTENLISSNSAYSNYTGLNASYCDNDIHVTKNQVRMSNQGNYGLYFQYCDGTSVLRQDISNNMVHIGGTTGAGYGIYPYSCTYQNYNYNSVNMTRTSTLQYAFFQGPTSGSSNINLQNNILRCESDFAIYIQQSTAIASSNYNDLYSTGANLGYWNGNRTDLAAWKAGSSKDNNSVSIDPIFQSNSNLHVQNYLIDNLGFPVAGISTDIDGQSRNLTTPDMGADEFSSPVNDAGITSIDRDMTLCASSDSVFVTLKNYGTSTLTSATINWSVNGVTQTPFAWTGSLAQGNSEGPFSVGFYNFNLGVPYTVHVWTTAPNGGSEGFSYNDTASIFTTYQAMAGTYTIGGTTPDFATFTAATNSLIQSGVCGPVTFNVRNGVYNEQISLVPFYGSSATNTVTYQGQSGDSTAVILTFTPASGNNYTVKFDGADYVTFRKMTIRSIGSSYSLAVHLNGNSHDITLANNVLEGTNSPSTSTSQAVILSSQLGCENFQILNNVIKNGSYGAYVANISGLLIKGNKLTGQYYMGIYLDTNPSMVFTENEIEQTTAYSGFYGMFAYACHNDIQITKNKINIPVNGYRGMYFQSCNGTSSLRQNISNNFIHLGGAGSGYAIYITTATYQNYFYNSFNNTQTSPSNYGFFLQMTSGSSNINLQNNIFSSVNGYAIYINQSSAIASSNYNDLYTTGTYLGYWNGNRTDLAAWKAASSKDNNSISIDPLFQSNSNLHTQNYLIDNLGFPVAGITTDIDNQTRNILTPDMGADEWTTPVHDAGILAIDQNATLCASSDSVYVTVKNFGSATLNSVTVNWSVNGVTQTPYAWNGSLNQGSTDANLSIGAYNFVLGVPYTIHVWTSNPNGNPEGLSYNDTSSIVSAYMAMEGTYTIGGTTPDFATFNTAVTALVQAGVCGPVVFNVRSGVYNEQVSIGQVAGVSAFNTVTFQSQAGDSTAVILTYTPSSGSNYTVRFNGADYITFRQINIRSVGSSYATAVDLLNASTNITLENNILEGSTTTSSSTNFAVVYVIGASNDNLVIRNNVIKNGSQGIYSSSNFEGGIIQNNSFQNQYSAGIQVNSVNALKVKDNTLTTNTTYSSYYGIYVLSGTNNLAVTGNNIQIPGSGAGGIYIYQCNGTSVLRGLIANNFVSIGGASGTAYGIQVYNSSYHDFYYNSVNIYRPSGTNYAFFQTTTSGSSNLRLQNNIFQGTSFAIYVSQPTAIVSSNYNNLFTTGANLGYWNGNRTNLAAWQSASAKDNNSVSVNAGFISNTDLHTCSASLESKGFPVSGITADIDGNPRSLTTPDIGADEFTGVVTVDLGADTTVCDTLVLDAGPIGTNYLWSTGATSQTLSVTVSGNYWVDVSNACGTDRDTISVTAQPFLSVDLGNDTAICSGNSLVLDAGNLGSTYLWSTGATSKTITVSTSSNYHVTVSNGSCSGSDTVAVSVVSAPVASFTAGGPTTFCAGGSVLFTSTNASGNQWYKNGTPISGATAQTYSATTAGNYSLEVDNGACSDFSTSTAVTVNALPSVSAGGSATICSGNSTTLSGSGGPSWSWTPATGLSATNIPNPTANPVTTTTYTLTVTDGNGCTNSAQTTVTVNPTPTANAGNDVTILPGNSTTLTGSATGGSGGYTYNWNPGGSGNQFFTVSPTVTTTYVLTVIDASGCIDHDTVIVNVSSNPIALNATGSATICSGNSTSISASATGGTGSFTYTWMPGNLTGATQTVSPATTTQYIVTATDNVSFQTAQDTVVITVNPTPTANAGSPQSGCLGNSVTLNGSGTGGTGTLNYLWSPGGATTASITVSPLVTTTYTLTVSDLNGCMDTDQTTVTINAVPTAAAGNDQTICAGTSATLSGSATGGTGGFVYTWNPGNLGGQSVLVTPGSTTNYILTVTDGNLCSDTDTMTVNVAAAPVANAGSPASICQGNSTTLNGSGSGGTGTLNYSWSPGGATTSSITVSPVSTTIYTLTVTDANTCSGTDQVTVTVNPTPVANAGAPQSICSGNSATLSGAASGGSGTLTYTWTPGNLNGSSVTVNPTSTTIYTLTVSDQNNCTGTNDVTVTVNPAPVVNAGSNQSVCAGTAVNLSGSATGGTGTLTYLWTPGNLNGASVSVTPTATTTYTLTVSDAAGCSGSNTVTVTVGPALTVNAGTDQAICAGASANLNGIAAGGSGTITYVWTPGSLSGSSVTVSPASTTTFTLTATDGTGCSGTDDVVVTVNPAPAANAGADKSICSGESASLSGIGAGGTGTLTYGWNPGGLSGANVTVSPTSTTNYALTVTDANGCTGKDTVMVTVNALPTASFSFSTNLLVATFTDLSSGGATAWAWNFGDGQTSTLQNPVHTYTADGTYNACLTVTNADGCEDQFCANVAVTQISLFEDLIGGQLSIYPNPHAGRFTVEFDLKEALEMSFEVVDLRGVTVYESGRSLHSGLVKQEINLDQVSAGIYFLRLKSEKGELVRKVVRQ